MAQKDKLLDRLPGRQKQFRTALLWNMANGSLLIAEAWLVARIVNEAFLGEGALPSLWLPLGILLVVALLRGLVHTAGESAALGQALAMKRTLRQAAADKLAALGPQFAKGEKSGELIHAVTEGLDQLEAYFARYVPQLAQSMFIPAAVFVAVVGADWFSAIILAVTLPLLILFMILVGKTAGWKAKKQYKLLGRLSGHLFDVIRGLYTLTVFNRSKDQIAVIARMSDAHRKATMGTLRLAFLSAFVMELFATLSTAVVAVFLGLRLIEGGIGFMAAFFVLLLTPEFYQPVRSLGTQFHASQNGVAAANRIFELLDAETPGYPEREEGVRLPEKPEGYRIVFDRVTVRHPGADKPALEDVSLVLEPGERVAIVGKSGAGKTTLLELLQGFIRPTEGRITVDGVDMGDLDIAWWRGRVAVLAQDVRLMPGSVRDNLLMANPNATKAELMSALEDAQAAGWVSRLPQGLDAPLGEAVRLSGGQIQRIGLARMFLKDAPVNLLDEPTSGLDRVTEEAVRRALQTRLGGRQTVTVAHRLETIRAADRIIALADGRIRESGAPRELLARGGLFADMVQVTGGSPSPAGGAIRMDAGVRAERGSLGAMAVALVRTDAGMKDRIARIDPAVPAGLDERDAWFADSGRIRYAGRSGQSGPAEREELAEHAEQVGRVEHVEHAGCVEHAEHAGCVEHVEHAGHVEHVEHAGCVEHVEHAGCVEHVEHAGCVEHAELAGCVEHVEHAGCVEHAELAGCVEHVEHAGHVEHDKLAGQAGRAERVAIPVSKTPSRLDHAELAGQAEHVGLADQMARQAYADNVEQADPVTDRSVMRLFIGFLRPFKWRMLLALLLGSLTIGASVGLMATSGYLISKAALRPETVLLLWIPIVGVRFFGISRGVFRYLERLVSHDLTFRVLHRIRVWIYARVEPRGALLLEEERSGDLLDGMIRDVEHLQNLYLRVLAPPLVAVLITALGFGIASSHHPLLGLALAGMMVLAGAGIPLASHLLGRRTGVRYIRAKADLSTGWSDLIGGLAELTMFGKTKDALDGMAAYGVRTDREQARQNRILAWLGGAMVFFMRLAAWLMLALSVRLSGDGVLEPVFIASLVVMTLACFEAVIPLPEAFQNYGQTVAAAKRLIRMTERTAADSETENRVLVADADETTPAADADSVAAPSAANAPASDAANVPVPAVANAPSPAAGRNRGAAAPIRSVAPCLSVRNLGYRYHPDEPRALQDLSLTLRPGRRIAIVGESGAGKSTFLHLLLRLRPFEEGVIALNGTDIREMPAEQVREQFAVVSQRVQLFNATVEDNLRIAKPSATLEEMREAARLALIDDTIAALPDGYRTVIGEWGSRLSGGERQRLALARALLRDAPFVLFDEPATGLDPLTESSVRHNLNHRLKDKGILWITHKLDGLERMDEIIVLSGGVVAERGTHAELIARDGDYSRMWWLEKQFAV